MMGRAVHFRRHVHAVPVHGGVDVEGVGDVDHKVVALLHPNGGPKVVPVISESCGCLRFDECGFSDLRDQFEYLLTVDEFKFQKFGNLKRCRE